MKIIKMMSASILTGTILLSLTACFPTIEPEIMAPSSPPAVVAPTAVATEIQW